MLLESLMTLPVALPVLLWAVYHYYKDRHLPEPLGNLALCFLLGIGAAWLSRGLYTSLEWFDLRLDAVALAEHDLGALLCYALLAIGPIEELSKLIPFLVVALRFDAFDDAMDGIVYASFIALGYAAIENAQYLAFLTPVEALARGFAGPVVHIAFASIWGYMIGSAFLSGRSILLPTLAGLLLSSAAHGIYDFFALAHPELSLAGAGVIVTGLWVWRLVVIRRLNSPHR
ncbi:MAG: PrsW family glutamic-type intramembrane protease [Pseudomonadota bacterium]